MNADSWFFNVAIFLALVVAGVILFNLKSSDNWKEVTGSLVKLEVSENYNRYNSTNRNVVEFPVDVSYVFEVDGKSFEGEKIYAGLPNVFTDHKDMKSFLDEYQGKEQIQVFYNEADPTQSALRKANMSGFALGAIGIFIIIIVGGIFWVFNKFMAE